MPVFNGEKYVEESIECVLSQSFGDYEFLISDNASTDRTEEICRDYAASDSRIQYFRNEKNIGAANNYNVLFERGRARYFRWMNADDLIEDILHERCFNALEEHSDAVLAYGKTRIIDQDGQSMGLYDDNLDLQQSLSSERFAQFFQNVGLTNAIYGLMRRDALAKTLLLGDGTLPAADYIVQAELLLLGKFIEIPELLFHRRMHSESSSADRSDDKKQMDFWNGEKKSKGFWMPTWRTSLTYARYASKLPLPAGEKWRVYRELGRQMRYQYKELISEIPQIIR